MILHMAVPMSYAHERYFGRPSCPKCGELIMAPNSSEYRSGSDIRHIWACDGCDYRFETSIRFNAGDA
jgi:RNase P subunit RPR2